MKSILLIACLCCYANLHAKSVFNFSSGVIAYWNDAGNWVGGIIPTDDDSVLILPPDDSPGYTCIFNAAEGLTTGVLLIQKHATLIIQGGKSITFKGQFNVEKDAALDVYGYIYKFCRTTFLNAGKITIETGGEIGNDYSEYCLTDDQVSSFTNTGTIFNHGVLALNNSTFNGPGLFINYSSFDLGLKANVNLSSCVNYGTISGNAMVYAVGLLNNGVVNIIGHNYHYCAFISNGNLVNNGKIYCDGIFTFTKFIHNTGTIESTENNGYPRVAEFENPSIINDGGFSIYAEYIGTVSGTVTNNNSFSISNATYEGSMDIRMSILNNGTFYSSAARFIEGSVINNKTFYIKDYSSEPDSVIIEIPFINKGTLISGGPIRVSNVFINSGELITN